MDNDFKDDFIKQTERLVEETKEFAEKYAGLLSGYQTGLEKLEKYEKKWWVLYRPQIVFAATLFIAVIFVALLKKVGVCGDLNLPADIAKLSIPCKS
jgi:hypothetical protein